MENRAVPTAFFGLFGHVERSGAGFTEAAKKYTIFYNFMIGGLP